MRQLLLIILIYTFTSATRAQEQQVRCHYEATDSTFIEELLKERNTDVLHYARSLIGRRSVSHMKELFPDDEQLVINTNTFDCTTFIELVVALTQCAQHGETTFEQFAKRLQRIRYWDGVCNDYTSRKHYFSDWIRDNSRQGFVTEVHQPNPPFTGIQTVKANFMTKHPTEYLPLKNHPEYLTALEQQEKQLSGMQFRYIPTKEVNNTELMRQTVHDGDIIAMVSRRPGLDIAHLAFAVWYDDGLHMLDASSKHNKVTEEVNTLRQYLESRKSVIGIRIIRVKKWPSL